MPRPSPSRAIAARMRTTRRAGCRMSSAVTCSTVHPAADSRSRRRRSFRNAARSACQSPSYSIASAQLREGEVDPAHEARRSSNTRNCATGGGSPASSISSRSRVSCGDSASPSASAAASASTDGPEARRELGRPPHGRRPAGPCLRARGGPEHDDGLVPLLEAQDVDGGPHGRSCSASVPPATNCCAGSNLRHRTPSPGFHAHPRRAAPRRPGRRADQVSAPQSPAAVRPPKPAPSGHDQRRRRS